MNIYKIMLVIKLYVTKYIVKRAKTQHVNLGYKIKFN